MHMLRINSKSVLPSVITSVIASTIVLYFQLNYFEEKILSVRNSNNEMFSAYKKGHHALTNTIDAMERVSSSFEERFLILSNYMDRDLELIVSCNAQFYDALLSFEVYGDTVSISIFQRISRISKKVDSLIFEHQKRREIIQDNIRSLCAVNKWDSSLENYHKKVLRQFVALENHFRYSLPIYGKELHCLGVVLENQYKQLINSNANQPKIGVDCNYLEQLKYFNSLFLRHAYYRIHLDFESDDLASSFLDEEYIKDSLDRFYERRIYERSLLKCN